MPERSFVRRDWLLLFGFCGFLFFFGLSYFGLLGADEPRYAQVAREMFERHDWITPTLGGKPWLEKPIVYYWQAMLAYRVFGVSDWAARIPSAIDATLMVLAIYLFLRKLRPGFHLDTALITASAAGVIGFARAASMDMPLASAFTVAMLAWFTWHESERAAYLSLFYFCIALGTLAKGPVAPFLAAVIIIVYALARHDYSPILKTLWIPGVLLFLFVALPWYVAVQLHNPQFFREFILEHNLARFGTNLYRHSQPSWYYVPVLLLALIPWVVFLTIAASNSLRVWWRQRRTYLESENSFNVFLLIWLIVPVIFFSISQSKLPGYILPALPAGTILLGEYVRRPVQDNNRPNLISSILHSIVASAPIVPAVMIQYIVLEHRLPLTTATAIASAAAIVIAAATVWTLRTAGLRMLRFTLVPIVLIVAAVLKIGAPALDAKLSARPVWQDISRMETQALPIAVSGVPRELDYGLHFYGNRIVPRYETSGVPDAEHIVIAPAGSRSRIETNAPGRRISYLGNFPAQHLEYFWVAGKSR